AYELYLEQIKVHETSYPLSLAVDVLQAYHPDLFYNYFAITYSQKTNDTYRVLVTATDYNTARAAAKDIVFSCCHNNDLLDPKEIIAKRTDLNFDISLPRSIYTLGPKQLADTGVGSSTNTYILIPQQLEFPSSPISEIPYYYTREPTPPPQQNRFLRLLQQTFSPATRTTAPPLPPNSRPANWLKEFRRAATANKCSATRKLQLAPVYLNE
ncbi:824_t:CDS:2, partial [Racocetra persica]